MTRQCETYCMLHIDLQRDVDYSFKKTMNILITCLRRSGSTVFWKYLKSQENFIGYDEPFNPMLSQLPKVLLKENNLEIIRLYESNPSTFKSKFTSISYADELKSAMNSEEIDYLNYLFNSSDNVVIDTTRCNFRIRDLLDKYPDVKIIYLYRNPEGFVSSNIIPNRPELKKQLVDYIVNNITKYYNRMNFWNVRKRFDSWDYESMTNLNAFKDLVSEYTNIDRERFETLPAYIKLYALWWLVHQQMLEIINNDTSGRIISVSFNDFLEDQDIKDDILRFVGIDRDRSNIQLRTPNFGYDLSNKNWETARKFFRRHS